MLFRKMDVDKKFDRLWAEIKERKLLSFDILDTVPGALSDATKKKLIKKSPEEIAAAIKTVIDEINSGSMKTIDELVRKQK